MVGLVEFLVLVLPLMLVCLLVGLGLGIAVIANEGRGWTNKASRVFGLVNSSMVAPLGLLAGTVESGDVRLMFLFAAGAFAVVGVLGFRMPRRFRDSPSTAKLESP